MEYVTASGGDSLTQWWVYPKSGAPGHQQMRAGVLADDFVLMKQTAGRTGGIRWKVHDLDRINKRKRG
jgi:hypothetical protein